MPVLNELLEANKRFAEGFEKGDLPAPGEAGRPTHLHGR
jgi:hypothetical protein